MHRAAMNFVNLQKIDFLITANTPEKIVDTGKKYN